MNDAGLKLSDKAIAFAVRIVNLYKWLCDEKESMCLASNSYVPAQASEPTLPNQNRQ